MGNKILNAANIKKTIRYFQKNGFRHACYAALERLQEERGSDYRYEEPTEEALAAQGKAAASFPWRFSIVVPAYETKEEHLRDMVASVCGQSFDKWELIIVDASESDRVQRALRRLAAEGGWQAVTEGVAPAGEIVWQPAAAGAERSGRIRCLRLSENRGISENTNAGIRAAEGDYIALLDHDDFITPDALYEMAAALQESERQGQGAALLYSDEDKYDESSKTHGNPHKKQKFNLDLILSNNYICHFLTVEAGLMKELCLRPAYDGAQDYDLVLRAVARLLERAPAGRLSRCIVHVPKILYHWRIHAASTAGNTASKSYAYEAGRKALLSFCKAKGWQAEVSHGLHLGFYEIAYQPSLLAVRQDVGIVGGRLLNGKGRICGGAYGEDGSVLYEGLHREYSGGSAHRAALKQDVAAVDIRCMQIRPQLQGVFQEVTGLPYRERELPAGRSPRVRVGIPIADISGLFCDEAGYRKLSLAICQTARERGYLVVWDPGISLWK